MFDVASRIKKIRKAKGMSGKEISISLGFSQAFFSGLENGTKKCSLENLELICNELDISLSNFFAQEYLESSLQEQQIITKIKSLSPSQLKALEAIFDTWFD